MSGSDCVICKTPLLTGLVCDNGARVLASSVEVAALLLVGRDMFAFMLLSSTSCLMVGHARNVLELIDRTSDKLCVTLSYFFVDLFYLEFAKCM